MYTGLLYSVGRVICQTAAACVLYNSQRVS